MSLYQVPILFTLLTMSSLLQELGLLEIIQSFLELCSVVGFCNFLYHEPHFCSWLLELLIREVVILWGNYHDRNLNYLGFLLKTWKTVRVKWFAHRSQVMGILTLVVSHWPPGMGTRVTWLKSQSWKHMFLNNSRMTWDSQPNPKLCWSTQAGGPVLYPSQLLRWLELPCEIMGAEPRKPHSPNWDCVAWGILGRPPIQFCPPRTAYAPAEFGWCKSVSPPTLPSWH